MGEYKIKITAFLGAFDKKTMPVSQLESKCRTRKKGRENFTEAFSQLRNDGIITVRKGMKVGLCSRLGVFPGTVTRLSRTFGFALSDNGVEFFIPGKCMLGAMPGDRVLISPIKSRSGNPEGEVIDIISFGSNTLTGTISSADGELWLVPDSASRNHIAIVGEDCPFAEGDKVLAEIVHRGHRHAEHTVKIVKVFGSADSAYSCSQAILAAHGVSADFSSDALMEAVKLCEGGIQEYNFNNREDLRDMTIFTIDSADSKDLDDAVSLEKTDTGWLLGVHIADVSHYVKGNSSLDKEALSRGTSIYYADKVIPMLPKELSNGLCPLNPGEDRLTLSAFIELDELGKIEKSRFCKSVIRSRVKGVYSEVNLILSGSEDDAVHEKYKEVRDSIFLMDKLTDILIQNKKQRHAPEIETVESRFIMTDGVCSSIVPRERGRSERIIEEFMITANQAAAKLAREKMSPFVYRIHEAPPPAKIEALREILPKFGSECPFTDFSPAHAEAILESFRGTDKFDAVNMLILRSMAKAKYSPEPIGHFGLALEDYAHFTSPIRRYPDLAIHRIITDILAGYGNEWLSKRYSGFVTEASESSTTAEARAVAVERECEDCYKAEFMLQYVGKVFDARISSVMEYGFYVRLENTVEGFIHIRDLPDGEYDYSEPVSLTEKFSGTVYEPGKPIRVICAAVNVSQGTVDFVPDSDDE